MSPKDKKALIVIGLFAAGLLYVYIAYVWKPLHRKIQETRAEVAKLEKRLDEAVARSRNLHKLFADVTVLKAEVSELEKQLPTQRELPDLLRLFAQRAQSFGLEVTTFSPGGASAKGLYDEIPYNVTLQSDFHSLGRFMTALGKGKRILALRNLALTGSVNAKDPSKTFTANLTLVAFKFHG